MNQSQRVQSMLQNTLSNMNRNPEHFTIYNIYVSEHLLIVIALNHSSSTIHAKQKMRIYDIFR